MAVFQTAGLAGKPVRRQECLPHTSKRTITRQESDSATLSRACGSSILTASGSGDQSASTAGMGTILSAGYLQSILSSALQSTGLTPRTAASTSAGAGVSSVTQKPDSSQLSPFAQIVSSLQQLQQSNPSQYRQVTGQIASNLQNAAQTAQAGGNPTAAGKLSQLATDFANASRSGQIPSFHDLAHGIFGSTNQTPSQLFSSLQTNEPQSGSLNPVAIILNTLSGAGIGTSNSR